MGIPIAPPADRTGDPPRPAQPHRARRAEAAPRSRRAVGRFTAAVAARGDGGDRVHASYGRAGAPIGAVRTSRDRPGHGIRARWWSTSARSPRRRAAPSPSGSHARASTSSTPRWAEARTRPARDAPGLRRGHGGRVARARPLLAAFAPPRRAPRPGRRRHLDEARQQPAHDRARRARRRGARPRRGVSASTGSARSTCCWTVAANRGCSRGSGKRSSRRDVTRRFTARARRQGPRSSSSSGARRLGPAFPSRTRSGGAAERSRRAWAVRPGFLGDVRGGDRPSRFAAPSDEPRGPLRDEPTAPAGSPVVGTVERRSEPPRGRRRPAEPYPDRGRSAEHRELQRVPERDPASGGVGERFPESGTSRDRGARLAGERI